jgi:glycosylphosphatidylinositol phospholipase D
VVNSDKDGSLPLDAMDLDTEAHKVLDGVIENGKFGTGLAVVDLNRDGVDDLAVSAPSTGVVWGSV